MIMRGNGKQILFECDDDYRKFLHLLEKNVKAVKTVEVHAYCLMNNHVHLLVSSWKNGMSGLMHRLGSQYASYYNWKYDHTGHVFQGRYRSEMIRDNGYLVSVLRYILQNPVKAGLSSAALYPWSSYGAYGRADSFVKTDLFLPLIGDIPDFERFILSDEKSDDDERIIRAAAISDPDVEAHRLIRELCGVEHAAELKNWPAAKRNEALRIIRDHGVSVRRLERLSGVSRGVISRL